MNTVFARHNVPTQPKLPLNSASLSLSLSLSLSFYRRNWKTSHLAFTPTLTNHYFLLSIQEKLTVLPSFAYLCRWQAEIHHKN
jgi:hypothetical protein